MLTARLSEILKVAAILYPQEFKEPLAAKIWADELAARTDPDFVLAQLRNYSKQSKYISLPEFLQYLREADLLAQDQGKLANERLATERERAIARRAAAAHERSQVGTTWRQIDEAIAAQPDDELAEWKRIAIEQNRADGVLHELGAAFLTSLNPRKSTTLRAMIYHCMTQG
nr:hypothetical protein [uncultured Rhodopila sp.]